MINSGDKFVIEIEAVYGRADGGSEGSVPTLYRAKGFRSLVFDEEGLKKLVPLDRMRPSWWEEIYQRGLDEAWEAARKLYMEYTKGEIAEILGMKPSAVLSGMNVLAEAFVNHSASEAIAKIREYEEKKKAEDEAINVGDEVKTGSDSVFVVVYVFDGGTRCAGYNSKGEHIATDAVRCHKTGRHFPQIAEVLAQIANDE